MLFAIDANIIVFALTGKPSLRLLARQWRTSWRLEMRIS